MSEMKDLTVVGKAVANALTKLEGLGDPPPGDERRLQWQAASDLKAALAKLRTVYDRRRRATVAF